MAVHTVPLPDAVPWGTRCQAVMRLGHRKGHKADGTYHGPRAAKQAKPCPYPAVVKRGEQYYCRAHDPGDRSS